MKARIAALETYIPTHRNFYGAAVETESSEVEMAVFVARALCSRNDIAPGSLDTIIYAGSGIRPVFPSGAVALANALGVSCCTFDVTAGCNSMNIAIGLAARMEGRILVVCSDLLSHTIDLNDPSHIPLRMFADGAAAVLICHNAGRGPQVISQSGRTSGQWREYYSSVNGKLLRSIPALEKKSLSEAYVGRWTEICLELLAQCPSGTVPRIYANQGDAKLFPLLLDALKLPVHAVACTQHGHSGGADPWVAFEQSPPAPGDYAIVLSSGIGFSFHGILLEMT